MGTGKSAHSAQLRRRVVAAAAIGSLAWGTTAAAAPLGSVESTTSGVAAADTGDDTFYVPPADVPAGEPGDVIRSRASANGPSPSQKLADAWQVMYLSTDALGEQTTMTGTVLVPKGADAATAPIVGLGPGTQGISFRCAPSKMIDSGAYYEQHTIDTMLRAGYAVAVPDYEGYHPEPEATYMTGPAMGPALIDVVRAAQQLPEAGLSAGSPVVFRGYSQGGGAAMWAGEMQPTYAPELDLVGVVGGGVPANLSTVAINLNGSSGFGLMAIALIGFDNAYPDVDLDPFFNTAGREAFAQMESGDCALDLLTKYAGKTLNDYFETNPLLSMLGRVDESTLGRTAIEVPVFQYHATSDGLVDHGQAANLRDNYCGAGVDLVWKTYDTGYLGNSAAAHISPISWAEDDALSFIEDRLAGASVASTC